MNRSHELDIPTLHRCCLVEGEDRLAWFLHCSHERCRWAAGTAQRLNTGYELTTAGFAEPEPMRVALVFGQRALQERLPEKRLDENSQVALADKPAAFYDVIDFLGERVIETEEVSTVSIEPPLLLRQADGVISDLTGLRLRLLRRQRRIERGAAEVVGYLA